jgi:hypothetical protein
MKMNKLTKVAMLAIVAASLASVSASAQNVSTSANDLILGFEITDNSGQGATSDLEVDLGSITNFTNTASLTLSQLSVADLVSTYGSGWATRSDLAWGAAGVISAGSETFDATINAPSSAKNSSQSALNAPTGAIGALYQGLLANSTANSWTGERTNLGGSSSDFQYFNPTQVTDTTAPVGSINLYSFFPSSGRSPAPPTLLGSFSLSSAGALTYVGSAYAVPEPSAYALGICAALLFVVLRRRQTVA